MDINDIRWVILSKKAIIYRRVSTKAQAKEEYAHQYKMIRKSLPELMIKRHVRHDLKEVMSGFASPIDRIEGQLGRTIRELKRDDDLYIFVSEADRISRTAIIFERIKQQGLGNRVIDVSTGNTIDDIIEAGIHHQIEKESKAARAASRKGLAAYVANGGQLGNPAISKVSSTGQKAAHHKALVIRQKVLKAISDISHRLKGGIPTLDQIEAELDAWNIRTTHGKRLTKTKLSQLKKGMQKSWWFAENSYEHRKWWVQRIKRGLDCIKCTELRKRRGRQRSYQLNREKGVAFQNISSVLECFSSLSAHAPGHLHLSQKSFRTHLVLRSVSSPIRAGPY